MTKAQTPKTQRTNELEIRLFADIDSWTAWLEEHHAQSPGLWLRIAKKAASLDSVSYVGALEVALCFGWIDGQKKTYDGDSWIQKFTPRRRQSLWSKVNREKVIALIEQGAMRPAGMREIERAQQDGRWDAAYDPASQAQVPADFQAALEDCPIAKKFFATLNSRNRYAILFAIQTAKKPETRAKRIQKFIEMLEKGESIYR